MKYILTLFLFILCSCDFDEKEPTIEINKTGIGTHGIGDSYKDFISIFSNIQIVTNEGGLLIKNKNKDLLWFNDKNNNESGYVNYISFISKRFVTSNGIHVGISINELTTILKEQIEVTTTPSEGDTEYIFPNSLQSKDSSQGTPGIVFMIIITSYDNNPIGEYNYKAKGISFKTTNFRTNGYVSRIVIYNWN